MMDEVGELGGKPAEQSQFLGCLGAVGILALLVALIGIPVAITVRYDNAAREARVAAKAVIIEANGGKFKVLYVYPRYVTVGKAQTMMSGHTAVLEGAVDGTRIEALATGPYPVPGETWKASLAEDGTHYVLERLLSR